MLQRKSQDIIKTAEPKSLARSPTKGTGLKKPREVFSKFPNLQEQLPLGTLSRSHTGLANSVLLVYLVKDHFVLMQVCFWALFSTCRFSIFSPPAVALPHGDCQSLILIDGQSRQQADDN